MICCMYQARLQGRQSNVGRILPKLLSGIAGQTLMALCFVVASSIWREDVVTTAPLASCMQQNHCTFRVLEGAAWEGAVHCQG